VQHGAIVVATGGQQIEPREYLYGEHPRVVTQRELEEMLAGDPQSPISNLHSVVMIQCVGSRDEEHPYCSRICCTEAIKNALAIKECSPETEVTILYRDIRTFGFKERYYRQAREKGVRFLEYDKEQKPEVEAAPSTGSGRTTSASGHGERLNCAELVEPLRVEVTVQPEGEVFSLEADLVVLSAGIEPGEGNEALARLLRVPLTADNFFLEAHVKLRPLDFAADGVYLCGMAHSPRFLDETVAQARGAAVRVASLLSKDELEATPIVASVNPRLCSACGLCVEVCPYDARVLEPDAPYAEVIEVLCQGCGACVAACPNKASQQKGFELPQLYGMLDALTVSDDLDR
jgi:heterodisulfide reductase subunit A